MTKGLLHAQARVLATRRAKAQLLHTNSTRTTVRGRATWHVLRFHNAYIAVCRPKNQEDPDEGQGRSRAQGAHRPVATIGLVGHEAESIVKPWAMPGAIGSASPHQVRRMHVPTQRSFPHVDLLVRLRFSAVTSCSRSVTAQHAQVSPLHIGRDELNSCLPMHPPCDVFDISKQTNSVM